MTSKDAAQTPGTGVPDAAETDPAGPADTMETGNTAVDGSGSTGTPASRPLSERKAELFRALAHPARIRALEILVEGERSVGELQPLVGIESSHLSQQLAVLRRANLVTSRKAGSNVLYAIRDPELVELLAVARRILIHSLTETQDLLADLLDEAQEA